MLIILAKCVTVLFVYFAVSALSADQSLRTGHDVDWFSVKILACDYNEHNLFYLESLLILKHKPISTKMQTFVNINLFT